MDAKLLTQMLSDKSFLDIKKMQYKYSPEYVFEMLQLMKDSMFQKLNILDFEGRSIIYLDNITRVCMNTAKVLLAPQGSMSYGLQAMEDEIHNTLRIENIESSRDSIRKILNGYAPATKEEYRIFGMKKGLEFISNKENKITEENLYKLYKITVGDFLEEENKLLPGNKYRHDKVYVVGSNVEHEGITYDKLPEYMTAFMAFINDGSEANDLIKAAIIHFYFAYLHPYFDGNGRTARFLHLWFLVQQGYTSAMFVPFSSYINETKDKYNKAFKLIEDNAKISGVIDVTPFLVYFVSNVYDKLGRSIPKVKQVDKFAKARQAGMFTEKEIALWNYVLAAYGVNEFSTKQLERDFGDAAYATIRSFVLKFSDMGLLEKENYANRPKYKVCEE